MKRRCEAMTPSTRPRSLSKASATRPTSSAGASTVAARQAGSSPPGSMASISAAMRLSGPSVRRTDRKATATAKASPRPLAQATADRRLSTVRSRLVVVAATSRVPRGSPFRTSGTVRARTSPSPGPGTVHHRPSVAPSRSSRRSMAPRSRPPPVDRTSPAAVRTAMTSSSAWACTASQRRASAASWAGSVTRPAGPSRNEVAAEPSRRSSDAPRSSRIRRAATPATTRTVAATRRAAMAVSRVGRLMVLRRGGAVAAAVPSGGRRSGSAATPPPPAGSVVVVVGGGGGGRRAGILAPFPLLVGRGAVDLVVDLLHLARGHGGRRGRRLRGGGRRRRRRRPR